MTLAIVAEMDRVVLKPWADALAKADAARWARLARFGALAGKKRRALSLALGCYPRSPESRRLIREMCQVIRGLESVKTAAAWRGLYEMEREAARSARQALAASRWR